MPIDPAPLAIPQYYPIDADPSPITVSGGDPVTGRFNVTVALNNVVDPATNPDGVDVTLSYENVTNPQDPVPIVSPIVSLNVPPNNQSWTTGDMESQAVSGTVDVQITASTPGDPSGAIGHLFVE